VTESTSHSAVRALVLVTVGSDYHPFDRLVGWVDNWLATKDPDSVDSVMQYGTARQPRHGVGRAFLPHHELLDLMERATVVVSQGGPLSLIEARRQGGLPIAVPRSAALGEVVDDHQHSFCRHMHAQGLLELALDEESLHRLLDAACVDPSRFRLDVQHDQTQVDTAVRRFIAIADELMLPVQRFLGRYGRVRRRTRRGTSAG
jgi:UDP-N-acetylglucosamine transferase subunit ALG13